MHLFETSLTGISAEGPHRSVVAHSLYQLLSFLGVPDHKVRHWGCSQIPCATNTHAHTHTQGGIVLLLAGMFVSVAQKRVGRKLSVELGGEREINAEWPSIQ